jgi:hypothetical protein
MQAATRPVLFVGHGFGRAAIVEAARAVGDADVRGAFLVAPPDEAGLERLTAPPGRPPWTRLPWPSLVVASRHQTARERELKFPLDDVAFKAAPALPLFGRPAVGPAWRSLRTTYFDTELGDLRRNNITLRMRHVRGG